MWIINFSLLFDIIYIASDLIYLIIQLRIICVDNMGQRSWASVWYRTYRTPSEIVYHSAEDGWIEIDCCTHLPNFLTPNSSLCSFVCWFFPSFVTFATRFTCGCPGSVRFLYQMLETHLKKIIMVELNYAKKKISHYKFSSALMM